jgi:hypothetical protein
MQDVRPEIFDTQLKIISMTGQGVWGLAIVRTKPANTSSLDGCDYAAG